MAAWAWADRTAAAVWEWVGRAGEWDDQEVRVDNKADKEWAVDDPEWEWAAVDPGDREWAAAVPGCRAGSADDRASRGWGTVACSGSEA